LRGCRQLRFGEFCLKSLRGFFDAYDEPVVFAARDYFNRIASGEVEGNGTAIDLGQGDGDFHPHAHQGGADVIEFDPRAELFERARG